MRAAAVLLLLVVSAPLAIAAPIAHGEIVITDRPVDPASPTFAHDLETSKITRVTRSGDAWRFHVVVLGNPRPKDTSFRLAFYVWNNRKKQLVRVVTIRPPAALSSGGAFTSPVTLQATDHWAPGAYNIVLEAPPPNRRHALGSIELR